MTAKQKIKREILLKAFKSWPALADNVGTTITAETIDEQYESFAETDEHYECEDEFRSGKFATGLPCDHSRHYEAKAVAEKLSDGSWVG